nr:RagB/SusD family nutrient uptake outer membrane protein [Pedobacter sp. ASV2]
MKLLNKKDIITSLLIIIGTCFSGCKKFLNEPYDGRIELQFTEHYQQILADAYPGRQEMFTDILTDDYQYSANNAQASFVSFFLPLYQYNDVYGENSYGNPDMAYKDFYSKIYKANVAISGVPLSSRGSDEFKAAVMGEALLLRAYNHFMLVNLFAKHYNAATANNDLGIAIVTEVNQENIKVYKRNTVKEVYDQVEKDAVEGIALLKKGAAFAPKNPYHFSIAAANAFMSRVKLYKGDWAGTIKYADEVIAEKGRFVRNLAADLTVIPANGVQIFTVKYMDPTTHPSILMNYYSSANLSFIGTTGFTMTGFYVADALVPLLPPGTDLRAGLFYPVGTVIDRQTMVTKYQTQPNNPNSTFRISYFTMEEVLLNRAEAVLKNGGAVADALTDLEVLRKARYTPYVALDAAAQTPDGLLATVLLERRKEFIGEGMRWFDVKRLGIRVEHALGRGIAADAILVPGDLRTALQIPLKEQAANPLIQLNPR